MHRGQRGGWVHWRRQHCEVFDAGPGGTSASRSRGSTEKGWRSLFAWRDNFTSTAPAEQGTGCSSKRSGTSGGFTGSNPRNPHSLGRLQFQAQQGEHLRLLRHAFIISAQTNILPSRSSRKEQAGRVGSGKRKKVRTGASIFPKSAASRLLHYMRG